MNIGENMLKFEREVLLRPKLAVRSRHDFHQQWFLQKTIRTRRLYRSDYALHHWQAGY